MVHSSRRHHRRHHSVHDRTGEPIISVELRHDLDDAVSNLLGQMSKLGDPIVDALDVLGAADFATLVWRVPNPTRNQFVTDLGVPAAVKKPTTTAARLGLSRLRAWPSQKLIRAAGLLTHSVADSIDAAWHRSRHAGRDADEREQELLTLLRADPAQANVMRLTIVSHPSRTWAMTVAVRLSLENGLALSQWHPEAVAGVVAACRDLEVEWDRVDHELAQQMPDATVNDEHAADDDREYGHDSVYDLGDEHVRESPSDAPESDDLMVPLQAPANGAHPAIRNPNPAVAVTSTSVSSSIPPGQIDPAPDRPTMSVDDYRATAAALEQRHTDARLAISVVAGHIAHDGIPNQEQLDSVTQLVAAARSARDLLEATGHNPADTTTVTGLVTALAAAAESSDIQGQRDRIAALTRLAGPDTANDQIAELIALSVNLLAADTWDTEQRQYTDGLAALLDLIDAVRDQDAAAVADAHARAHRHLPANLAQVTFAAMLGQLSVARVSKPRTPEIDAAYAKADAGASTAIPWRLAAEARAGTPVSDISTDPASGEPEADPTLHRAAVPETESETGRDLVRRLVGAGQLSLAAHAAAASGGQRRADALRLLALAEATRSETSPIAASLRTALERQKDEGPGSDLATHMLLLAGAVRSCLVSADTTPGNVVLELIHTTPQLPHLSALCGTIGTASAHGWLYSTAVLAALAPIADADDDIAAIVDAAIVERDRSRGFDFVRANQIVEAWWSRAGTIGRLLDVAARDRRTELDAVTDDLRKLAKRLDGELMDTDALLRGHGSKPLQGTARRRLKEMAEKSIAVVQDWIDAVRASQRDAIGYGPIPAHLTVLRDQVKDQWPAADAELTELIIAAAPTLLTEAAQACRDSIRGTVTMLDGIGVSGSDRGPTDVLHRDLLRCPGLPFTDGAPARQVTISDVAAAADTTWQNAFDARIAAQEYATAALIAATATESASKDSWQNRLQTAATAAIDELRELQRQVTAEVARAARLGQLDEAAGSSVNSQLEAVRTRLDATAPGWPGAAIVPQDLAPVRRTLLKIRDDLPEYLGLAQQALRKRVNQELGGSPEDSDGQLIKAIYERIDGGDLATAEEDLLAALHGEAPPSEKPSGDLDEFLRLMQQVPTGITGKLIAAVRDGGTHSGTDFSSLTATERRTAENGLRAWDEMRALPHHKLTRTAVADALRLAGIEFNALRQLSDMPGSGRRSWKELAGVTRTGDPLVPKFGSLAGDRQRILLCWGDADVTTVFGWIAQDESDSPVIVLLFAPMNIAQRAEFAVACAGRPDKPVLLLDDIALIHLALNGSEQFSATERALLPFAATNPYHPEGNAAVPPEMFFGRSAERSAIIDSHGPNLLYGGRQLGKTALLQEAARRFERVPGRVAVYVSLPNGVGISVNPAVLWDKIAEKLTERNIIDGRNRSRDAVTVVTSSVTAWLAQNPAHRLLLLIDECDQFFDADALGGFTHVTTLRDLRDRTDRRFKPVFAGLHQVQRFAHLPNQPLVGAHLGEQIAIGPLGPEPAYQLLFTPMDALGIRFASDDLIHRVLAFCNYQPKLIQVVGQALVDAALPRRADGPPYEISEPDLDRVIGSENVQRRVRQTAHLTLNLDSRYKLIAYVVALAALEQGADFALSTSKLRGQCQEWWRDGFAGQGTDEFSSLLEEMRDLGVLAAAPGGWRLRSSNVLRLLGSADQIWEELCSSQWRTAPTKLSANQARRKLGDGLIAPCTEQQLSRLISRGSRTRVVMGTPATAAHRVKALLEGAKVFGAQFQLAIPSSRDTYRRALRAGEPGAVHRIVFTDLTKTKIENAVEALDQAARDQPQAGVTRTVVVVVDATIPGVLDALCAPDSSIGADEIVELRRVSEIGVRSWLSDNERMSCFDDAVSQTLLMDVTGGWTSLLDRATTLAIEIGRPKQICEQIRAFLATPAGAEELITQTGLRAHPTAASAFEILVDYAEPVALEELEQLCDGLGGDPARIVDALRMIDVLAPANSADKWVPEPVLAHAWRSLHHS